MNPTDWIYNRQQYFAGLGVKVQSNTVRNTIDPLYNRKCYQATRLVPGNAYTPISVSSCSWMRAQTRKGFYSAR